MSLVDFPVDVGIDLTAHARDNLIHTRQGHVEREGVANGIDGTETAGKRVAFGFRFGHKHVMRVGYSSIAFLNRAAHGFPHVLTGSG